METGSELEKRLRDKLGEEFQEKIDGAISGFGGLLTKDAAVRLLCKQNGIEIEKKITLAEARQTPAPFSFEAKIDRIFPAQEYGNSGDRSVRLHVSDKTWEATLVLWNEQAELTNTALLAGCSAEFGGAYFRGGEINLKRGGTVKVTEKAHLAPIAGLEPGTHSIEGTVRETYLDYHYMDKASNEEKTMSSFLLCQGDECRRVAVWSSPPGFENPAEGDSVLLENVAFRNGELHFNAYSRMVRKNSPSIRKGCIRKLGISEDNEAILAIGDDKFELAIPEALSLLGISPAPEGVRPETVLSIKGESLEGKEAEYKEEGGKLAWLKISEK